METGKPGPRVGVGRTAEIFAWGPDLILKLIRPEFPGRLADDEAAITSAVREAGIRAPAVEGLVEVQERRGILFERVEGPMLIDIIRAQPWTLRRLADLFADLHVLLHAKSAPPALPALRSRLEARILGLQIPPEMTEPARLRDEVVAVLARLPDGDAVCHGDLHPGNVIMSAQGPVIIDWIDASRGHPLADVARRVLLLLHSVLPRDMSALARGILQAMRSAFTRSYVHRYLRLRLAVDTGVTAWLPAVAAARIGEDIPGERLRMVALIKESFLALNADSSTRAGGLRGRA